MLVNWLLSQLHQPDECLWTFLLFYIYAESHVELKFKYPNVLNNYLIITDVMSWNAWELQDRFYIEFYPPSRCFQEKYSSWVIPLLTLSIVKESHPSKLTFTPPRWIQEAFYFHMPYELEKIMLTNLTVVYISKYYWHKHPPVENWVIMLNQRSKTWNSTS